LNTHFERDFLESSVDNGLSFEGRSKMLNARRKNGRRPGEVTDQTRSRSGADNKSFQDMRSHLGWKYSMKRSEILD